jgi:hypothetical protein
MEQLILAAVAVAAVEMVDLEMVVETVVLE